jgi:crotonobetainyl-CoA:carnitine CoA-transferase CaiB-like acyl-CoA transferase
MDAHSTGPASPGATLAQVWADAGMESAALQYAELEGREPVLSSSFAVSTAAQVSIAAAALAAAELRHRRGQRRQQVRVGMRHAAQACTTYFTVDGVARQIWDKLSGLYACGPGGEAGWVRIHANFAHHRYGALELLGLRAGPQTERSEVEAALTRWRALDFEAAAAERGLPVAALRTFDEWDAHPQSHALAAQPLIAIERIGDAPPRRPVALAIDDAPLSGLRVLDLTRILAGPVGTRTLAAHGADVMLVNSPHLPNVALPETSRGKLSAHVDLQTPAGREALTELVRGCDFFVQAYRPGAIARLGFGAQDVARLRPGVIYCSLSAYGPLGPWSQRRGFDSLVQTATGFNDAEGAASDSGRPKPLPMQILDHATGYLLALGVQAAFARQLAEGGSWHAQLSLARTASWLRSLGRVPLGLAAPQLPIDDLLETTDSAFGQLVAVRPPAQLADTPAHWRRPAVPPGTHPPSWPDPGQMSARA